MSNSIEVKDMTANPGPLGLCGFGMTTILLNLHNAGLFGMDTMIMAMGLFFGGLVQILVGMLEWKKNNMFGTIAFTSYGAFWIALIFLMILPKMGLGVAPTPHAMGYFLVVWGIFSTFLYFVARKANKALKAVFGTLVILFALLAIADFTGNHTIKVIAGIEGIICGALALYTAMAELYETSFGREVLPLGK